MTVSLAEATAAARRIQEDAFSNDPSTRWRQFNADARLLAGFVLAGLREVAEAAYSRGWQDAMREEIADGRYRRVPDASVGAKSFPQQGDLTGPAPGVAAVNAASSTASGSAFVLAGDTERLRADSRRLLALALVATGGEMTPEADALVPQDEWDALFADGLMEQHRPLHGEPYSVLLDAGRAELDRLRAALVEGSP